MSFVSFRIHDLQIRRLTPPMKSVLGVGVHGHYIPIHIWAYILDYPETKCREKRRRRKKNAKKLIHDIVFHPSSELSTGCSSTHVSSLSCQHFVTPFSLIQPLFICLTFSVSTLHQDSSAPPLTQELYAFRT